MRLALSLVALLLVLVAPASGHAAASAPNAGLERTREITREVLHDERYQFCHRADYVLFPNEKAWCPEVGAQSAVCPELPAACAGTSKPSGCSRRKSVDASNGLGLLGPIAEVLFWALVIAAVAGLVWVIIKYAVPASAKDANEDDEDEEPTVADTAAAAVAKQIETDVQRLLARARNSAQSGDFGEAIHQAHAAMVRRLEGDGLIRVHPSRTNGDFLMDLAPQPELRAEVRQVVRAVEGVEFGHEPPSRRSFDTVYERVWALVSRNLGKALLLVLLLGLAFSCDVLNRGDSEDTPSGIHGVIDLLNRQGAHAKVRVQALTKDLPVGVLALLPGAPALNKETLGALQEWAINGGTLISVGRRADQQCLRQAIGVEVESNASTRPLSVGAAFRAQLGDLRVVVPTGGSLKLVDEKSAKPTGIAAECPGIDRLRSLLNQRTTILDRDGVPYAVAADFRSSVESDDGAEEGGRIIVLADDHLFSNIALTVGDNAHLLVGLMGESDVEFVNELTGATAETPMASIRHSGLLPFLLQLGAVVMLFLFCQGVRFGTPSDPEIRLRRAFADHVRALGAVYAKAQAARHALASYSAYAYERLRERLQLRGRRGFHLMAESLAARTGQPLAEVARVLAETYELRANDTDDRSPAAVAQDLQLMKELEALMRAQRRRGP